MPALSMRIKSVTAGYPMACNACCRVCSEKKEKNSLFFLFQEAKCFYYVKCRIFSDLKQPAALHNRQWNPISLPMDVQYAVLLGPSHSNNTA
jgi:hypothetical protein